MPEDDRIGFCILSNGKVEVMYQTIALLKKDSPAHVAIFHNDKTMLFIEVDDIDAVATALQGFEIVMHVATPSTARPRSAIANPARIASRLRRCSAETHPPP